MGIPFHSKVRKKLRTTLNIILSKLSYNLNSQKIETKDIKKILIIRINYRIGNIIFLTPLIKALHKKIPNATIDLIVGAPFTTPIMKDMSQVENVYALPRDVTKNPIKLYKTFKEINKNNYDLVINPATGSVSTNIATFLTKAKLKLGFYKPNTWIPVNRSIMQSKELTHEALKPLKLMDIFDGERLIYDNFLDISISKDEREYGKEVLKDIVKDKKYKKIIAIFRDARYEKKIKNSWWKDFIHELKKIDKDILFVDILAPNEKKPLLEDMPHVSRSNLRELAKILSAFDAFICADTGPMHLASASLTPTIALFNATDPSKYGPLGERDKTIDINGKDISTIVNLVDEYITNINR